MDSLSCLQNVHNGEFARPILQRKEFVVKYLFKILYWNSKRLLIVQAENFFFLPYLLLVLALLLSNGFTLFIIIFLAVFQTMV